MKKISKNVITLLIFICTTSFSLHNKVLEHTELASIECKVFTNGDSKAENAVGIIYVFAYIYYNKNNSIVDYEIDSYEYKESYNCSYKMTAIDVYKSQSNTITLKTKLIHKQSPEIFCNYSAEFFPTVSGVSVIREKISGRGGIYIVGKRTINQKRIAPLLKNEPE